jgi:sugar/nucleoside kinase (ribokinase family)
VGRVTRPVVVVGDLGIDVLTRPQMPVVHGGEATAHISLVPGGAGGNTAAWLAAHDVDVSLIARIGDDHAGVAARASLQSAGVRCVFAVDEALPTCVVVVLVDPSGQRSMLSDRGASAAFRAEDVRLDVAARSTAGDAIPHLHLSGYVLFDAGSRAGGLAALAGAQARGWTTSVDPQTAELVAEVGAATFLDWVRGVDLLLPNEIEAEALGGPEAILAAVGQVVVTYGADGARWFAVDREERAAASAVECIDSTGAGDAFNAGLLASWLADADPQQALRAAVEAGSAAAAGLGARPRS